MSLVTSDYPKAGGVAHEHQKSLRFYFTLFISDPHLAEALTSLKLSLSFSMILKVHDQVQMSE